MRFKTVSDTQVANVLGHLAAKHLYGGAHVVTINDVVRELGEALGYVNERERLEWTNRVRDIADRS